MKPLEPALNTIDLSRFVTVCDVSSQRDVNAARWTELRIVHRPDDRRPFLCEIVGMSTVPGEQNRRRRRVFADLQSCFEFFDPGALADLAYEQAQKWQERYIARQPRKKADAEPIGEAVKRIMPRAQPDIWDGDGGIVGAIAWLYDDVDDTQGVVQAMFERDFGVPARTLRHSIKTVSEGGGLPSWAAAFILAMPFFDRERFRVWKAARRG